MAGAGVGVLERRGSLLLSLILPACPPWPLAGRACSLSPSGAYTCSLCLKYCPPPHICSAPSFPPQVIFKSWSCYLLSEACLAVLLKSKLQVPMPTHPVPYWQCFFTGLTYNSVTSMRVRVFFLFCSLCIPKAYNSFWVYSRYLINIS